MHSYAIITPKCCEGQPKGASLVASSIWEVETDMCAEARFTEIPLCFSAPVCAIWDSETKERITASDVNQMAAELDAVWEELVSTYCRLDVYGDDRCPANSGCRLEPCARAVGFRNELKHGPDCLRLVRHSIEAKLGI